MAGNFEIPEDVASIFSSDPYTPEEGGTQGEIQAEPAPAEQTPAKTEEVPPAVEPEEKPVEAVTPPEPAPEEEVGEPDEVALLKAQLSTLQSQLTHMQQQAQQPPKEQPQGQQPQNSGPTFDYNIPDQLLTMLESDNPADRKQALGAFAKAVSATVYSEAKNHFEREMTSKLGALPTQFQEVMTARERAQSVFQDFYGKYPKLQSPQFMPIVQQTAAEVMQEMGQNWTPQIRDEIGKRVQARLGMVRPRPAAPPAMMAPGTRPAPAPKGNTEQDDIARTLFDL